MVWGWVLAVALLGLAVVALILFQRATSLTGRIAVGIAAMIFGVLGLVILAGLIFS
jgi:hypothetical protein